MREVRIMVHYYITHSYSADSGVHTNQSDAHNSVEVDSLGDITLTETMEPIIIRLEIIRESQIDNIDFQSQDLQAESGTSCPSCNDFEKGSLDQIESIKTDSGTDFEIQNNSASGSNGRNQAQSILKKRNSVADFRREPRKPPQLKFARIQSLDEIECPNSRAIEFESLNRVQSARMIQSAPLCMLPVHNLHHDFEQPKNKIPTFQELIGLDTLSAVKDPGNMVYATDNSCELSLEMPEEEDFVREILGCTSNK